MRRLAFALVPVGIVVSIGLWSKLHAAVVAVPGYDYTNSPRFGWSIVFALAMIVAAYTVGLPDLPRSRRAVWGAAVAACVGAALVVSTVQLAVGDGLLPRFVVGAVALTMVPWFVLCGAVARRGRVAAADRDRVLIVADAADAAVLQLDLDDSAEIPAIIAAVLSPALAERTQDGRDPVIAAATIHDATIVVLDRTAQSLASVIEQVAVLHARGVRVRTLSLFYEQWLGKLPVSELERVSLMFDIGDIHLLRYGRVKRFIDITLALVGLAVLAAALPAVWIGNRLGNRGPLLYRQQRVGRNGDRFEILKFRTMNTQPDGAPNEWTQEDDPRITPFGRLLRRSHLDELPQVVNVLAGDLAVVGPRPEQPHYVKELSEKLPFYDIRHLVQPGITGWAQVKYGYGGDERDAREKLQYEFYYLRHQGLRLDLRVIARTLRRVLRSDGR